MTLDQWRELWNKAQSERDQANRDWWWALRNDRRNIDEATAVLQEARDRVSRLLRLRHEMIRGNS